MSRSTVRGRAALAALVVLIIAAASILILSASTRRMVKRELFRAEQKIVRRRHSDSLVAWTFASPKERKFDIGRLDELQRNLEARETSSLLIISDDRIVYEWYGPNSGIGQRHGIAAAAKPLIAGMALLLALDEGRVALDDPVAGLIPSWRTDEWKSRITLRHLATHTSGIVDVPFRSDEGVHQTVEWMRKYERDPSTRFSMALHVAPIVFEPGTRYSYSGVGYHVLAYVLSACWQEAPETDLRQILSTRIFDRLAIPRDAWRISYGDSYKLDGLKLYSLGSGASLTTRAIARLGQLMLDHGTWDGITIFNPQWMDEILFAPLPGPKDLRLGTDEPPTGVGWFLNQEGFFPSLPTDAYIAAGTGHNVLLVIPGLRLLLVRTGRSLGKGFWEPLYWAELEQYLFAPIMEIVSEADRR